MLLRQHSNAISKDMVCLASITGFLKYYNYDLWLRMLSAIQLLHWSLVGICITYTFLPNCSSAEHTVPNYEVVPFMLESVNTDFTGTQ